jgi:hypothetical protein
MPAKVRRLRGVERQDPDRGEAHERVMEERRQTIRQFEHGKRCCLYHSLLGHADGAILAAVYSQLSKNGEYLKLALRQGTLASAR